MAKYNVNFNCGHTEEIQLVGKLDDRYNRIALLEEEGLCSECYKEKKRKQLEKESEGLPALKGSEKQINWAMKIRLEKIRTIQIDIDILIPTKLQEKLKEEIDKDGIDKFIDKIKNTTPAEKQQKTLELILKYNSLLECLKKVETTTSAKWLIDNQ